MREQILTAATQLMAANGASGTSLQAIADEVGIRKASILYHFPSKEALRKAVMAQLLYRWNEVLPRVLFSAAKRDSEDRAAGMARFDAVIEELMRFFVVEPDRARLLVRELLDRPKEMEAYLREYIRPWMNVVSGLLEKGKAQGVVHADLDPQAYIVQITILSLSVIATAERAEALLATGGPEARERLLSELVRIARASLFANGHARGEAH